MHIQHGHCLIKKKSRKSGDNIIKLCIILCVHKQEKDDVDQRETHVFLIHLHLLQCIPLEC